ncbi:MAG TPA: CoA transferase, partial [Acidimicrobiales bacterium]|nr:CoA transferase [Acidimicrobiales bacterium]
PGLLGRFEATLMGGPLDDLKVLEIASWVAAPSCAALMADMGADVVKVEPLTGDGMRAKLRQPAAPEGVAAYDIPFQLDNRGKRGIAVDLSCAEGSALVRDLALGVDVVVTNVLPGRLRRFGLGAEQLRSANPRLVYALVTGYGSDGDDADRPGFDLTAFFGRAGIMSLVGEPGEPPPAFRSGQGDHPTGLALLVAVLAALRDRDRTGEGQVVETALLRTGAWSIGCDVQVALVDGEQPRKRARDDAFSPLNTRYRCADGVWLNLVAQDPGRWAAFCEAVDRPDLAEDERFATPALRFANRAAVIGALDELFSSQPAAHWAPLLDRTGMVWSTVAELPDLVADPQARAIGMFVEVDHPAIGTFETLAAPFTMGRSEVAVRGRAPEVGEHTVEVLADWGIEADRVASLRASGVIA